MIFYFISNWVLPAAQSSSTFHIINWNDTKWQIWRDCIATQQHNNTTTNRYNKFYWLPALAANLSKNCTVDCENWPHLPRAFMNENALCWHVQRTKPSLYGYCVSSHFFSVFTCISLFILICINKTVCFLCKMRMLRAIRREKEQKKRCIGMDGHTDHDANRANTSSLSLSISVKLCINLIYFNSIMAFVFILFLSTSRIWCVPSIFFYLCIYLMLLLSLSSFVFTCQSVASLLSCAHKLQYVCIGQEEVWHRRHINI